MVLSHLSVNALILEIVAVVLKTTEFSLNNNVFHILEVIETVGKNVTDCSNLHTMYLYAGHLGQT